MRYYDQLEIIPIFQVSWIIFNMLFGLILLEEGECYSNSQLVGIFSTSLIGVIGMYILFLKQTEKFTIELE